MIFCLKQIFLYCYNNYFVRTFQEAIEIVISAECLRANSNEVERQLCDKVNSKLYPCSQCHHANNCSKMFYAKRFN